MKKNTINCQLITFGGLIGLGILGYLLLRTKTNKAPYNPYPVVANKVPLQKPQDFESPLEHDLESTKTAQKTKAVLKSKTVPPNDDFPLKIGSKGKRVTALQTYLLKHHGYGGLVTDDFDNTTAARVKRFLKVESVSEVLFNKLMAKSNH